MKILNKEIKASSFLKTSHDKFQNLKFEHKLLIAGFIVIGAFAILHNKPATPVVETRQEVAPESVDTYIPHGFTLIPLEISNSDALASIMGDMGGVVDLYLTQTDSRKGGIRVASRVKLLRAPRNPEQFAVLVKESEGQRILQYSGPFLAVVQNPDVRGGKLAAEKQQNSVRIDYAN
ncbi:hypothetical protein B9G69_001090 [Bdellovibrio sp. SKB1291214]|uniref:hypothetical protein n=1 Tax=Bdellovibrio sp. SKB1291214 TaxID=1732569 RepID=UPI0020CF5419|nr:hypothetical protein [Bdellovibrio sp. SKB1291214]UYL09170.1 hypothetical protein B9G69_001090 [Bdellovibrio sp. SKB1291214]